MRVDGAARAILKLPQNTWAGSCIMPQSLSNSATYEDRNAYAGVEESE
jgi:hypothetical protein